MYRLCFAILLLVATTGCASSSRLSAQRQRCVECALRAHADPVAAGRIADLLADDCRRGDARACSVLGVMYERGTGRMHQPHTAARLYRRACRQGNLPSCTNFGRLLETGVGGPFDPAGAEMTYELACHGGEPEGCVGQGRLLARRGAVREAAVALREGCRAGAGGGCYQLSTLYRRGRLRAATVDGSTRAARRYDTRACALGVTGACGRATQPLFAGATGESVSSGRPSPSTCYPSRSARTRSLQ